MDGEPLSLARRAGLIIQSLAGEIGPRPAGSPAENAARSQIESLASTAGYEVSTQPFSFASRPPFMPYYSLAAVVLVAVAWLLRVFPWAALVTPLALNLFPEIMLRLQWLLPRRKRSANLLALPSGASLADLDLLFVAHLDTARAQPFSGRFMFKFRANAWSMIRRMAYILALIAAVHLLEISLPAGIDLAAQTVCVLLAGWFLVQDLWEQLGTHGSFSPGANDNASGCAVLLTLAEQLAQTPSRNLRTGFLWTGAEECGLYGAQHAAKMLRQARARPAVVNVDMVGSGKKLRVITQAGSFPQRLTNDTLNQYLLRADPEAASHQYVHRAGDFLPFIQAKTPATSIETSGGESFWQAYHTGRDVIEGIEPDCIARTIQTLLTLVSLMDRDGYSAEKEA